MIERSTFPYLPHCDPDREFTAKGKQCEAFSNLGVRCRRVAIKDQEYCRTHRHFGTNRGRGGKKRPKFYSKTAGKRLQQLFEEVNSIPQEAKYDLSEEVDVARILCKRSLRVWEKVHFEKKEGEEVPAQLIALANAQVRDSLSHVSSIVEKMTKIDLSLETTRSIPLEAVSAIIEEMRYIMEGILVKELDRLDLFEIVNKKLDEIEIIPQADHDPDILIT